MRKRFYVGHKEGKCEVFSSAATPTPETTPQYAAVTGPFRTKRGAEFMRDFGRNNPHCRCVAEAEKLAKKYFKPRCKQLEDLARDMVGDGKTPNIFFVSDSEVGVVMITRRFFTAYDCWRAMGTLRESNLEDRKYGTICTVEPETEGGSKLVKLDNSQDFLRMYPQE